MKRDNSINITKADTSNCLLENRNIMLGISIVLKESKSNPFHCQMKPCSKCKKGYTAEECSEIAAQFTNIEASLTKISEIIG
ncbi:MAG: hypothetical protein GH155_01190 [Spirochaeta sp.]|nr:hypothetical protein [Spirochaeta sp.]